MRFVDYIFTFIIGPLVKILAVMVVFWFIFKCFVLAWRLHP